MAQRTCIGSHMAPGFPPGLGWLNRETPISLQDLRGKIATLDFWTHC